MLKTELPHGIVRKRDNVGGLGKNGMDTVRNNIDYILHLCVQHNIQLWVAWKFNCDRKQCDWK